MTIYNIIALGFLIYSLPSMIDYVKQVRSKSIKWYNFLDCGTCLSFWVTLIVTKGDLSAAALVSLTVLLLDSFITTKL